VTLAQQLRHMSHPPRTVKSACEINSVKFLQSNFIADRRILGP
jgi:hypothetical protein